MNRPLKIILVVVGVVVIAAGVFIGGLQFARTGPFVRPANVSAFAYGPPEYAYGPGLMGRDGGWARPGMTSRGGWGPGMMQYWSDGSGQGFGPGMMQNWGGYGPGPGMMQGWSRAQPAQVTPLTIDEARQSAADYIESLKLEGLEPREIMIFDNHAYVVVKETATGLGAFELLVDPASKVAYPEHGPNMMWNLKYGGLNHAGMMGRGGMMGGWMMGGWQFQNATPTDVDPEMAVNPADALKAAQAFLDQNLGGATAASTPVQFYGYYTFDYEQNGRVAGMLSVNGYNSQVFLHTWHGNFIEEAE